MFCPREDIGAIVADVGSYATRIGFGGDDNPRANFPTCALSPSCEYETGHGIHFSLKLIDPYCPFLPDTFVTQHLFTTMNALPGTKIEESLKRKNINFDLDNFREGVMVENPIKEGLIDDWDLFEQIW